MAEREKKGPKRGINTENSYLDQPQGAMTFALNTVNGTSSGDADWKSNEESNDACYSLPEGFVPIGQIFISKHETVIFSCNADNSLSEIGLANVNCTYNTLVRAPLGFKISHQISGTYRLRRGCERNIYWVDGNNNKPRYFNLDSPEDFKDSIGAWDNNKFELTRSYEDIPLFTTVEVLDSGGQLEPGSYNISIQYLDENLNPTEWIFTSPTIKIYNDLSIKEFREIRGSINSDAEYLNFPITNKAINVKVDNLDPDFLYYRLAFIEATSGSGLVSNINVTEVIPTTKDFFIYTGQNFVSTITEEEIVAFSNIIYSAEYIEQIENRLVLANTRGKQVNFCALQKYASRIKADCTTKTVILTDIIDPSNPKNPTHAFGGTGYMPGEIYSFGIVYIFADGSISPTYHIPGKSHNVAPDLIYAPGEKVYPMSPDNSGVSLYTDNDNCGVEPVADNDNSGNTNYWGLDSEGETLNLKNIRHHRFPLRSEIGVPLITDVIDDPIPSTFYNLTLTITGDLITPGLGLELPGFEIRVSYTVNGQDFVFFENIEPNTYVDASGVSTSYPIVLTEYSQYHSSNLFIDIVTDLVDANGDVQDLATEWATYFDTITVPYVPGNIEGVSSVTVLPGTNVSETSGRTVETEIFGINFSAIDVPSPGDVNGEKVVGYYIVRNERTEFDKTILDSGVLIPTVKNEKYISHGLLQPEGVVTTTDVFGIIHPEHKFHDREYFNYDEIIQEGNYNIVKRKYGKVNYDDVQDGSSYNSKRQKDGNDDGQSADGSPTSRGLDGWSFNLITRDNIVEYESKNTFNFVTAIDVKESFYLGALESRTINDTANDVYNISTDNKIGILQLEEGVIIPAENNLPYVILKKRNLDSYSNFRVLPYYKDSNNPFLFPIDATTDTATVFGGDSFVSPMRYANSCFWTNRPAKRAGRTSALTIIVGVLVAIIGVVLAAFTFGTSTLLVGVGIAIAGAGALITSSGIKQANFNKAYNEEYDKGLRETLLDDWVDAFYNYRDNSYTNPGDGTFGFSGNGETAQNGPSDDTIQWIGDCITDLWFESKVNISLRNDMIFTSSPFLDAPGKIESGNDTVIGTWEFFDILYANSNSQRYPISSLERHLVSKLLYFDPERDDTKAYLGIALGEWYNINPDYTRLNNQKVYYHLALEYDCCSDCQETFPQRVVYSEQSFQEELSDNYRIFLPNNYRDIEGEKGVITDLFRIQNNLYIHTEGALWHLPQVIQERVTGDVVSFIGTGSFFSIPPRKITDTDKESAGTEHNWGRLKTANGVFYPSANEGKVFLFNGDKLNPISLAGMDTWFKKNMPVQADKEYLISSGESYAQANNPSSKYGTGYVSVYDTENERFILTKKDFVFTDRVLGGTDYDICVKDDFIIFDNLQASIDARSANGWLYVGIEDCRLKFTKDIVTQQTEIRYETVTVANDADVVIQLDRSGSFSVDARNQIKQATIDWKNGFAASNPTWGGNLYFVERTSRPESERWLLTLEWIKSGIDVFDIVGDPVLAGAISKNIIAVSFVNENEGTGSIQYHLTNIADPIPTPSAGFLTDYPSFVTLYNGHIGPGTDGTFIGLIYPIVMTSGGSPFQWQGTNGFLQHVFGALKGGVYSTAEVAEINEEPNPFAQDWGLVMDSLTSASPYVSTGLDQYGWKGVYNRGWNGTGDVITSEQFQEDMGDFLEGSSATIETEVTIDVVTTETEYEEGVVIEDPVLSDLSWTMSYDLGSREWVSWHSYMPNFYFYRLQEFYSWKHYVDNSIWKHNTPNSYQTFYGTLYPHIIEYVDNKSPRDTKLWEYMQLQTRAERFDANYKEFTDKDITFNKILAYTSKQATGWQDIVVKVDTISYLDNQVTNSSNSIIADRNERTWTLNDLRDITVDYDIPIFRKDAVSLSSEYYTDKVLNLDAVDYDKPWYELQSLRDKYLVVRLKFDNFDDIRLVTNFTEEIENKSHR